MNAQLEELQLKDYLKAKRRRSFIWGAGVGGLLIGAVWAISNASSLSYPSTGDHIASIRIEGPIFTDQDRQDMIDEISERDDVKALIVNINSPGGMVYPSYQMYESIKEIAGNMPTVAVMEDYAASGGLMVAMGTPYVFASPVTVTGSIGVIGEMQDFSGLMEKIGVGNTVFRTSDVKGGPSPFRKPTQAEIASVNKELSDTFTVFKDLVKDARDLAPAQMAQVATGDAFVGKVAMDNGLVDAMGNADDAQAYLIAEHPELEELDVIDWEPLYEFEQGQSLTDQFANALIKATIGQVDALRFERAKY